MTQPKLEPCPFCGGTGVPFLHESVEMYGVECSTEGCDAVGPARDSKEGAIMAWNTRTRPAHLDKIHELRGKYKDKLSSSDEFAKNKDHGGGD